MARRPLQRQPLRLRTLLQSGRPTPGSILPIILIGGSSLAFFTLSFPFVARCRIVKVLATDSSIQFSESWTPPTIFDFNGSDQPGLGGPNSSVCAMRDISRYTTGTGEGFQFSFRGIGAQLVLTSRPDHSRFTVTYDSHTYAGDSYSQVVGCGVAWSSPVGSVVDDHVVTCTNNPAGSFTYLELLSILYDDGSDLPPPSPPASSTTSSSISSTSANNTTAAALPPNSPTVGSASDTGSPSGSVTSGLGSESPSTSTPTNSITVIQTTIDNPVGSHGHPIPISVGAIAGVAVSAATAVLLVLFLLRRWRRRLLTRRSLRAVRPLSLTAPATSDSTAVLMHPTVSPGEKAMREARPSMRLADEDIDRIAARMHDMIHSSVRHRRADSTGTVGSEARDTSLPSYFTSSAR